jgi:hypothetical protein
MARIPPISRPPRLRRFPAWFLTAVGGALLPGRPVAAYRPHRTVRGRNPQTRRSGTPCTDRNTGCGVRLPLGRATGYTCASPGGGRHGQADQRTAAADLYRGIHRERHLRGDPAPLRPNSGPGRLRPSAHPTSFRSGGKAGARFWTLAERTCGFAQLGDGNGRSLSLNFMWGRVHHRTRNRGYNLVRLGGV